MSENKKAGLNRLDMQAVIAAWIIANEGCGDVEDVSCLGKGGMFSGTTCPLNWCDCNCQESVVKKAKQWFNEHHRKAKAAKEQEVKPEPAKSCGDCQHASACFKIVPVGFIGCPNFEPKISDKSATEKPSPVIGTERKTAETKGESCGLSVFRDCALRATLRRIIRLEKENAKLQGTNTQLQEQLVSANKKRDSANSHLLEQFKQMGQRIKDLERELSMRNQLPRPNFFVI